LGGKEIGGMKGGRRTPEKRAQPSRGEGRRGGLVFHLPRERVAAFIAREEISKKKGKR